MKAISKLIRQMAMATALVGAGMGLAQAETIKLTILGVGDVYNFEGGKVRGGFARLNALAKAEKAANPNFLYLFDGDMFSPSLLSGFDKGENTVTLTNLVPFDLAVPGNHEFDFGTDNFKALVAKSNYPWAAINLTQADGTPVPGVSVKPVIKEVGGLKIGLVPAADESSPITSSTGDYKFGPSVEMSIAAAKDLRKQGADLVIAVFQGNHEKDMKLLASHAFDLILSGDDHDYWTAYDGVSAYVETSTDANYLTPIDLIVDLQVKDGKRTVTWTPNFRFVDTASVKPDPETQALVDGFKKKLADELNVTIGKTVGDLDSRRNLVRKEEATMGNLIADAIKDVTGSDFAITNGGGIRADKQYAAGSSLTRKDIFAELPFGNLTTALQLSGKDVLAALENGVSQVEQGAGRFPQVSAGLVVTYDPKKPAGSRLVSVTWNGKPIDPAGSYKVATNDYMLSGGDGYTSFKNGKVLINEREGHLMASDVIDWITKKGTVDVKLEGRIVAAK